MTEKVLISIWSATAKAWLMKGMTREEVAIKLLAHLSPLAAKEVLKSV